VAVIEIFEDKPVNPSIAFLKNKGRPKKLLDQDQRLPTSSEISVTPQSTVSTQKIGKTKEELAKLRREMMKPKK
jgi:hypothetical protein